MLVSQIPTPALVVDLDALERNHQSMMDFIRQRGLRLRPHYKSHKSTWIAHYQMANGACGMTCAKVSEAEDLLMRGGLIQDFVKKKDKARIRHNQFYGSQDWGDARNYDITINSGNLGIENSVQVLKTAIENYR